MFRFSGNLTHLFFLLSRHKFSSIAIATLANFNEEKREKKKIKIRKPKCLEYTSGQAHDALKENSKFNFDAFVGAFKSRLSSKPTCMKFFKTLFLILAASIISCKDAPQQNFKPSSIGPLNSITVVIDSDLWKGKVGDKIREHFAAPAIGLTWNEPLFTINPIPRKVFSGSVRNSRSILYVAKDSSDVAFIKENMYARPQRVAVFKGKTDEDIMQHIDEKAAEMITAFKEIELKEEQQRFLRSLNKETILQEKFGIKLNMPSAYKSSKQEDNFVWIDREILKGNMNIIVYELPNDYFKNDSTLVKDIIRMRDSIGQKYIPGPDVPNKITHMRTEPAFSPYISATEVSGISAVEVKGVWDIKNYPMAGPFITYIINDKENDRKLVIEGFTFAPATDKRDYMFQLEAILKTVQFTSKD